MRSLSTARFYKFKTCPSAETLLSYVEESLAHDGQRKVATHISTCDFCGAELQFLAKHPPKEVRISLQHVAIPPALRCLAKDLMAGPERSMARFIELTCEKERLTLTDA